MHIERQRSALITGIVTGIVLLPVGFIVGPVLMLGQAILGGWIIANWTKVQQHLSLVKTLNRAIAAVLLVLVVGIMDVIFITILARLVQSAM